MTNIRSAPWRRQHAPTNQAEKAEKAEQYRTGETVGKIENEDFYGMNQLPILLVDRKDYR